MNSLLIDTSTDSTILALLQEREIISLKLLEGSKKLSSKLFPALQSFCKLKDLTYITVGIGPGSYMGIRTAAIIAKTLGFALNLPLITFFSPLAFLPKGKEGSFAIIRDAKMDQFYLLTGVAKDRQLDHLSSPILVNSTELKIDLLNKDFIVGEGHLEPELNLEWIIYASYEQFIQGNFSNSSELVLSY